MTTVDEGRPPWFAFNPDGSIHLGGVPERILRHPGLQKRRITPVDAVKPVSLLPHLDHWHYDMHAHLNVRHQGVAFRSVEDRFIVKALNLETEELQIYERLIPNLADPANHIVPCDIERDGHPLLIMPILWDISLIVHENAPHSRVLRVLYELVEGVEYLHRYNIVHMDICYDNAMVGLPQEVAVHPELVSGRVYLIDFDSARQFHLGPGVTARDRPSTNSGRPSSRNHVFRSIFLGRLLLGQTVRVYIRFVVHRTAEGSVDNPVVYTVAHR
ncbi:hypothetical protein NUW54_g2557 [Trametes sanguinea]|uniref:Uncharacterized protein n=1 Tax=Trametes sanguinea TaxID=158606 RepID=A0ACC1Q3T6_9APHY|nr:hypothetical protein NUW54_g2557 [Trametes sanguinea]